MTRGLAASGGDVPTDTGAASWFRESLPALVIGLVICALYSYLFAFRATADIDIESYRAEKSWFKVYWAAEGEKFAEGASSRVRISGHASEYRMFLTNLRRVDRLRIDPLEYPGHARLRMIRLTQPGFKPLELRGQEIFDRLRPLKQISHYEPEPNGAIRVSTSGRDGQLELALELEPEGGFWPRYLLHLALIMVLALGLGRTSGRLFQRAAYVPWCLGIALVLAFVMASISRYGVHPDEGSHARVIEYFTQYWLPPAADAPEARFTYTHYGTSRVNNFELYYMVTGYLSRGLDTLRLSLIGEARLFGLALLALMAWLAARNADFRLVALPLLLTPQAWYLYSYANSDAWALFICLIMAWMAASPGSPLNRYLVEDDPPGSWLTGIGLGLLVGSLFLIKLNFYTFILFLGLYFLWRLATGDFPDRRRLWLRLSVIVLVAASVYGARYAWDVRVNGPDRSAKLAHLQNENAIEVYRAETPLEQQHYNMHLKQRGVSIGEMISEWRWGGKVYISAFGGYGFIEFMGSDTFYELVRVVGLLLVLTVLGAVLVRGPPSVNVLSFITLATVLLAIMLAFWTAWTVNFQPQGRYLAPVLPALGVYYFHARPYLYNRVTDALVIALFALGVYSFIFTGLTHIPKTSYFVG